MIIWIKKVLFYKIKFLNLGWVAFTSKYDKNAIKSNEKNKKKIIKFKFPVYLLNFFFKNFQKIC